MKKKLSAITQSQTLLILGIVFLVLFVTVGLPFLKSCKQKVVTSKLRVLHSELAEANYKAFLRASENAGEFNVGLSTEEFVQIYFEPYLSVKQTCSGSQSACWNNVQYKDLKNKAYINKIEYSLQLKNGAVLGFRKNNNGRIFLIMDIDGKSGDNILGKDVFVYSVYNSHQEPICEVTKNSIFVKNGLHFGGVDECGIPHDAYGASTLQGTELKDACNKNALSYDDGIGVGAACLALIKANNWTIDKRYPW